MGWRRLAALVLTALLWPAAAHAAWVRAETDRFIVYGDVGEQAVRDYAVKLNTFDTVLHVFNPRANSDPPPRRFEVYLVSQQAWLLRAQPNLSPAVLGFYATDPQASFSIAWTGSRDLSADTVIFHEYAHHFMLDNFQAAYPAWFVEGWAEYFGNTEITPGLVKVGNVNAVRMAPLQGGSRMRWQDLLTKRWTELPESERDYYYPQAWLLVHYMMSDKARSAQLNRAIADIAAGKDPLEAFKAATGMTITQLGEALRDYRKGSYLTLQGLNPKVEVKVTKLSAAADDLLMEALRLARTPVGDSPKLVRDIRARAAKHPGDPFAEQVLALAEFTGGDVKAGEAIINRRLAAAPNETETLRVAGVGQILAGERNPAEKAARFRAARPLLIKAYGQDGSDFRTLFAYAFSRTVEPDYPNENDITALTEAHGLAPGVDEISLMAGSALMKAGRQAEAKHLLSIVANDPHGRGISERARTILSGSSTQIPEMQLAGFIKKDD